MDTLDSNEILNFLGSTAASTVIVALLIWLCRSWLIERLKGSIKHEYDKDLEGHKAEIRRTNNEEMETIKAEHRRNEAELAALTNGVLSGRMNRQSLVDQRKIKAVETVWGAANELKPLKQLAGFMVAFKLDALVKRTPNEPNLQKIISVLSKNASEKKYESLADNERPFLGDMAWAYFAAYQSILGVVFGISKALEVGLKEADQMIDKEKVKNLIKTVLPHQSEFIDSHEITSLYYLLEELEEKLLAELKKTLQGEETDQTEIELAKKIIEGVNKVNVTQEVLDASRLS
ncbi:MAG: hypothetical protein RIB43_05700 [Rhodospirillaceae bacterium]